MPNTFVFHFEAFLLRISLREVVLGGIFLRDVEGLAIARSKLETILPRGRFDLRFNYLLLPVPCVVEEFVNEHVADSDSQQLSQR
jgi:hypothetical protein